MGLERAQLGIEQLLNSLWLCKDPTPLLPTPHLLVPLKMEAMQKEGDQLVNCLAVGSGKFKGQNKVAMCLSLCLSFHLYLLDTRPRFSGDVIGG